MTLCCNGNVDMFENDQKLCVKLEFYTLQNDPCSNDKQSKSLNKICDVWVAKMFLYSCSRINPCLFITFSNNGIL